MNKYTSLLLLLLSYFSSCTTKNPTLSDNKKTTNKTPLSTLSKHLLAGILLIILSSTGCKTDIEEESLFKIDHVLVWVEDPGKMKAKIEALGFKGVPDSLSQVHQGQGTSGRYFYFLNGYLELIYVNDLEEFQDNIKANDLLDFAERKNHAENGFSPFGIGLKMKEYAPQTIPFETIKYRQSWMKEGKHIYSAADSKKHKVEPSVFVVYPEIASEEFENEDSLSRIPEEYAIWRSFHKHKNGVKKITKLIYTLKKSGKNSNTLEALKKMDMIDFKLGEEYFLEIYFDNHRQKKKVDLRPELPIKIYF